MSRDREPAFSLCCCMRADCSDHDCPGRLQQQDGGAKVTTDFATLLDAPLVTPASAANQARIAVICVAVVFALCSVAKALGFHFFVPF